MTEPSNVCIRNDTEVGIYYPQLLDGPGTYWTPSEAVWILNVASTKLAILVQYTNLKFYHCLDRTFECLHSQ
jgi:hypothetical protein